jgi:hypothetical protein
MVGRLLWPFRSFPREVGHNARFIHSVPKHNGRLGQSPSPSRSVSRAESRRERGSLIEAKIPLSLSPTNSSIASPDLVRLESSKASPIRAGYRENQLRIEGVSLLDTSCNDAQHRVQLTRRPKPSTRSFNGNRAGGSTERIRGQLQPTC